ncbi:hypothetical protein GvMRE_I2g391 [endosymbiont GvMRE of Glomus versiforme]|nr:hypothetical protein GvMRE_I2g391 [endosymbiont GvMRE of Glomus versiforme]
MPKTCLFCHKKYVFPSPWIDICWTCYLKQTRK